MKTAAYSWNNHELVSHPSSDILTPTDVQLVLCFGARRILQSNMPYEQLRDRFPAAEIILCSTAGEIYHTNVLDNTLSITAIQFSHTSVQTQLVDSSDFSNSFDAGKALLEKFTLRGLRYVLVLSDGSKVNGSELVRGINEIVQHKILVTGGLAGDGSNFQSTLVGVNGNAQQGLVVAIGFYGDRLQVNHGSQGGWEMFGLEKEVTKSDNNFLFEIDNKNALEIYKQYLGPEADSLPGSALLFPLAITLPGETKTVVRTILSIDEKLGSMTFAGDIPKGAKVRFMKANFDKLTNAASEAAAQAQPDNQPVPQLALLISCVGRKLILKSRIEEEVEAIDERFHHQTLLTGFYSYGEISPLIAGSKCQLHNQTMTITTFYEME